MDRTTRTEAVEIVRQTLDRYRGATRLRFTTYGGFFGFSRLEVKTLGESGVRRAKGTEEQRYISYTGDMFAPADALPMSAWLGVFVALEPSIRLAAGCTERSGFDVDAEGRIFNRYGTYAAQRKEEARLRKQAAESGPRIMLGSDGVLTDFTPKVIDYIGLM